MRALVFSALLILLIGVSSSATERISLVREEVWTPDEYAEVIQKFLDTRAAPVVVCDCADPSPECEGHCRPIDTKAGWHCGTPSAQMDRQVLEAIEKGDRPSVIVEIISRHPAPFDRLVLVRNRR